MAYNDAYVGRVVLLDGHNVKRRMTFQIATTGAAASEALDYEDARATFVALLTDLISVTDASIVEASLSVYNDADFLTSPVVPGGSVYNKIEARVIVGIDEDKVTTLTIPAPVDGLFLAGAPDDIDPNDVALQAYVANFVGVVDSVDGVMVSDGEALDLTLFTAGIKDGWRGSRSYSWN